MAVVVRYRLTPRQRACLRLRCQGLTAREIGERLCIAAETVKHHLTLAYERMDLGPDDRTEHAKAAALACYRIGWADGYAGREGD